MNKFYAGPFVNYSVLLIRQKEPILWIDVQSFRTCHSTKLPEPLSMQIKKSRGSPCLNFVMGMYYKVVI